MTRVGVLLHVSPHRAPAPPSAWAIGRAAIELLSESIELIFIEHAKDGLVSGLRAVGDRWEPVSGLRPEAIYDRFPSQSQPEAYQQRLNALRGVPIGNPPALTRLCRDKTRTQRLLEELTIPMPTLLTNPAHFNDALRRWGAAFVKPLEGSFGRNIRRVHSSDSLADAVSAIEESGQSAILQRAITPPPPWAGLCVRALIQREAAGWVLPMPIARVDLNDPVVNVARSGTVRLAEELLPPHALAALAEHSQRIAHALERNAPGALELGLDFVFDDTFAPSLIEVNGRPRGRLAHVARLNDRCAHIHQEAVKRPLRYLAELARNKSST